MTGTRTEGDVVIEPERRRLLHAANTDDTAGAATEAVGLARSMTILIVFVEGRAG